MPDSLGPVRIGVLGASSYAPTTMLNPAKDNPDVVVAAVGARDDASAEEFAATHGIARAHGSYEALIDDPELDAIYVLVPTSMHGRWTRAALDADKHVLCEKPFTANGDEAREVAELAATSDRVVMEAIQFRHHPLTLRVEEILASGELGRLERVDITLCVMLLPFSANCYNYSMAGGAMMDAGSYVANMARTFGGSTPKVVSAQAKLRDPRVDAAMTAEVQYAEGHTGRLKCALWSSDLFRARAKIIGEHGEINVFSPAAPHLLPRLSIRSNGRKRVERFPRRATYAYQLDAFASAVLRGGPVRNTPQEAVENMSLIDDIYRAAGLPVRQPS
ncbi:Gfo/Idh/MocA family protein [Mycolicibacterium parafortuitum]|uniref:NAD binding oxidoreductase [Amycolatopsis mediterranei S699] n=1 Tax=Mycolicibacterium parafortuitum TaxID=39692 RepID=A0A375YMC0_MYCPF|nr:Gfo/Idh/MocA family oxidoreductase [Mycolicibacterium parafortuitum]ORB27079.1 oxidoreductase [Mycolicibacterium parafortuitum]SRX82252.1 NAD binding oxidoreductase [Amycolatopsis mediterranei S699] [Mycolicibacterium parafortuitum]